MAKKIETKWFTSPFGDVNYTLVLGQKEFKAALKSIGLKDRTSSFLDMGFDGQVTYYGNGKYAIVQINIENRPDHVPIYGLIVHEGMHVWQTVCERIGEKTPSREFEAYSVQAITQNLFELFEASKLASK